MNQDNNNILKIVTLDDGQPPTDNASINEGQDALANFETSQKNIFESSIDQRVSSIAQPQDMVSDATTNLNLMQTVASSGLSSAAPQKQQQTSQETHQEQQKMSYCSLFVIFGLNATEFVKTNSLKEQYDVLGSYPNLEQHPEVASEHKFVQDLRMICFPELTLKTERFKMSNMDPLCRCQFFHFISTNDMGDKKYLTSVHFKEILLCEKGAFVIDKAICVASSQPIFSLQKQVLHQIFQKVVLQNNNVSIKAFKQAQWTYDGFLDEYDQPPPHDFPNFVYKFMMDQVMCADNRKARDRDSDCHSSSPPQQHKKNNMVNAQQSSSSHLPVVDFTSIMELYISIFSKHLYFDPTVERDIHIIQTDNAPAATSSSINQATYNSNQSMFGTNFTSNTVSQQHQQHDQKANRHVPLFKFRNMKPFGFQLENYPFDLLLQTLKPDKLIQLVTALLLERKIVLIKREIGDIALIMQSLITLLSPFQWHFTIITYLTRELVDMLDAPFPFMIGVSWATWDSICLTKDYAEEIFIFDLESQERRYITKQEVPELPSPFGDDLLAGLKDVMDKKDRRLAALRAENKHSKSKSLSKRQLDQQFDEQYWADAQLSVKQLFFNFLLMTVNNYIQFYRTNEEQKELDDEAENSINNDNGNINNDWKVKSSEDFFDFQGYIEWQDDKQMERTGENNLFMREFVKTQAFHEFIEQNRNTENEGAENAAVFFESCIELLTENTEKNRESEKVSWKKLKSAQQEMIDQAKYNLATPVKFKFNGIYSKYVEGLRKREQHLRNYLEEIQPGSNRERKFSELYEADQIDDIIMKYIFMRPEAPDSFRQYSLISDVNQDMVFERIPKIRYDLVELYWQKIYKTKSGSGPDGGKQSHRSIENPPQTMHVNKPANMQRRKKRLSNKNEIEYEEYINNGNYQVQQQAIINHNEQHHFSDTGSQHSNMKKLIKKHNSNQQLLKKNRSGNIIHDYPSETAHNQNNLIDYTQSSAIGSQNTTELKSKKFERQAQSTRNFASLSVQKGTQRSSYNIKSYHHYTTNKAQQSEQLRIGQHTSKCKKSQETFQEGFASLEGQQLRQTRSPKVGGSTLAKSTTMSITRTAVANTLLHSGRGVLLSSNRSKQQLVAAGNHNSNMPSGSSKPSPAQNAAALTAIKTTRNKSHQSASLLKQQHHQIQQQVAHTTRHSTKQDAAVNFQQKVRAARQRGSIQYMPERQQQTFGDSRLAQPQTYNTTVVENEQSSATMIEHVEIIERRERCSNNADDFNVIGDEITGDGGFEEQQQKASQHRLKKRVQPRNTLTATMSTRQISPNPAPMNQNQMHHSLGQSQSFTLAATGNVGNKALLKQGKRNILTNSLTSLSQLKAAQRHAGGVPHGNDIQEANKPADRQQFFLVKGGSSNKDAIADRGPSDASQNNEQKKQRPKLTGLTGTMNASSAPSNTFQQTSNTPGNNTSRQHKMIHPVFSQINNKASISNVNIQSQHHNHKDAAASSSNSYSLDTIIPGRKSLVKSKQQQQQIRQKKMLENPPSIELLDASSGSLTAIANAAGGGTTVAGGFDQHSISISSSGANQNLSGIIMPEYTEKKAKVANANNTTSIPNNAATQKTNSTSQMQQTMMMTQKAAQSIYQNNSQKIATGGVINQRNNRATGGPGSGLSKVLRISYELPQSKNSFINIEKEEAEEEEEHCMDDQVVIHQQNDSNSYDAIFPPVRQAKSISTGGNISNFNHQADSSLMKDADKTELQDFTKQPMGMAAQQELQGGGRPQKQQQSDSQGSQGGGSILEIDPPPNKNMPSSKQMMIATQKDPSEDADDDVHEEDLNACQTTEGIGDGVNELIEDEAHMAQKTAYYLQYRTKFNKINSDSQIKMHGMGLISSSSSNNTTTNKNNNGQQPLVRKQMMPCNPSITAVLSREQSTNLANYQASSNNVIVRQSDDFSGSSASHNQLVQQLSGSSSDNKLSSLLHAKSTVANNNVQGSTAAAAMMNNQQMSEKQSLRKGPSMPLAMLLTKTNSRPGAGGKQRQPPGTVDLGSGCNTTKVRSITDKQFSFQEIARMPSHSLVQQPQQTPKMKSYMNVDNGPPKNSLQAQQSVSIPMPGANNSNDNHFQANCLNEEDNLDGVAAAADLEHDDEGWFTPIESKRLSQGFPNQPLVSDATKQKLQRFYSDIDGSFMDPPMTHQHNSSTSMQQQAAIMTKQHPLSYSSSSRFPAGQFVQNPNSAGISRQQQQLFKRPTQMQPPQQLIDSPQQSTSRKSSSLGKHPSTNLGRTAAIVNKVLANEAEDLEEASAEASAAPFILNSNPSATGQQIVSEQVADSGKVAYDMVKHHSSEGTQAAAELGGSSPIGLQHQQMQQQSASSSIIDNSIAAPNNGILFSHQKRRTERYRDDLS